MTWLNQYLQIILHLDHYLAHIVHQFGLWSYAILFLIIFCESGIILIPFLPGESLLFALGALAARGVFDLNVLVVLLSAAAILGGYVNYALGYLLEEAVFAKRKNTFIWRYIDSTHNFYEAHGAITVVLARFIPIVRTYAPFIAGVVQMKFARFSVYNILGGIVWVSLFIYTSYQFGNLPIIKENFSYVIMGIIIVSLLPVVIEFIRQNYTNKST